MSLIIFPMNRLGGLHRAANFMGDIGTIMKNSGSKDLFVESGIMDQQ